MCAYGAGVGGGLLAVCTDGELYDGDCFLTLGRRAMMVVVAVAQSLVAWTDAEDMYKLYLADKKAGGGGDEWDGLGESLPCVVFRTLYKAKRYEEALPYLEDALSSKK